MDDGHEDTPNDGKKRKYRTTEAFLESIGLSDFTPPTKVSERMRMMGQLFTEYSHQCVAQRKNLAMISVLMHSLNKEKEANADELLREVSQMGLNMPPKKKAKRVVRMSGYRLYSNEHREAVKAANPGAKMASVMTKLGSAWSSLSVTEQDVYNDRAKAWNEEQANATAASEGVTTSAENVQQMSSPTTQTPKKKSRKNANASPPAPAHTPGTSTTTSAPTASSASTSSSSNAHDGEAAEQQQEASVPSSAEKKKSKKKKKQKDKSKGAEDEAAESEEKKKKKKKKKKKHHDDDAGAEKKKKKKKKKHKNKPGDAPAS